MSFRFLKVSRFYPVFLQQYYEANPQIKLKGYLEQHEHLMLQGFSWANYLGTHLKNDFGAETLEIVSNATVLQAAWAKEHGVSLSGTQLIFEQIKRFRPDIVFLQDTISFSDSWIRRLKAEIPTVKLILGWRCAPYTSADMERCRGIDLMMSCTPAFVEGFRKIGMPSALLNHGFDASNAQFPRTQTMEVMFAGSLIQGEGYHNGRLKFLSDLVRGGIPIRLYVDLLDDKKKVAKKILGSAANTIQGLGLQPFFHRSSFYSRALQWKNIALFDKNSALLSKFSQPQIFGRELFQTMASAKININFHIDSAGQYAGNSRLFEATGSGSCLVTDNKLNMRNLFEPDKEIVTFDSNQECLEKLRWLLDHPKESEEIAAAGKKRCLQDHSFRRRAAELHEIMNNQLKDKKVYV